MISGTERKDQHDIRVYVIGGEVSNIAVKGTVLGSIHEFETEKEKTSFTFIEIIPALSSQPKLLVFRDFAKAHQHLTTKVDESGKKELATHGRYASYPEGREGVHKIAIPIFEMLVSASLIPPANEHFYVEVDAHLLQKTSPICGIIKDMVVYQDPSVQAYHDIFDRQFEEHYRGKLSEVKPSKEEKITGMMLEMLGSRDRNKPWPTKKIHSTEDKELAAHLVDPAKVLAETLKASLVLYDNPGKLKQFSGLLFGTGRTNHESIVVLQAFFTGARLTPTECVAKLSEELKKPSLKENGEYAKLLRVLLIALNVSYKIEGNTLEWTRQVYDLLNETPICARDIKNIVYSYIHPCSFWQDTKLETDEDEETRKYKI